MGHKCLPFAHVLHPIASGVRPQSLYVFYTNGNFLCHVIGLVQMVSIEIAECLRCGRGFVEIIIKICHTSRQALGKTVELLF